MDGLSDDTTHNALRWINRSAKIVWTKKPVWAYIFPPPLKWVGTITFNTLNIPETLAVKILVPVLTCYLTGSKSKGYLVRFLGSLCPPPPPQLNGCTNGKDLITDRILQYSHFFYYILYIVPLISFFQQFNMCPSPRIFEKNINALEWDEISTNSAQIIT